MNLLIKKNLQLVIILLLFTLPNCDSRVVETSAEAKKTNNVYNLEWITLENAELSKSSLNGKVTLVVNVASKCGYTKQYKELQELHDSYEDFQVIGFPCNDFGGQEPGDASSIQACAKNYEASFTLMSKISISNDSRHPIYQMLFESMGVLPKWNFGKYLIDKNGSPIAFFSSNVKPLSEEITQKIELALQN